MFSSRIELFLTRQIYEHSKTEAHFTKVLKEALCEHKKNHFFYQDLCEGYSSTEFGKTFHHKRDVHQVIPIPTLFFKRNDFLASDEIKSAMEVTSSGTSGNESRMRFTKGDILLGVGMMIRFFKHHKILSPLPTHYIVLGYELDDQTTRGAMKTAYFSTKFAPALSRTYALRRVGDGFDINYEGIKKALLKYSKGPFPIRFVGFPSYMYFLLDSLAKENINLKLPKHSSVLLGGGWKNYDQTAIEPEVLQQMILTVFGISKQRIHEFFSAVEHPLPYHKCEGGAFHVPAYSRVFARDVETLEPLDFGEMGLLNFVSPLVMGTPVASVITDDLGTLYPGHSCICGNPAPYFKLTGRAGVEAIKTCTVEAAEHMQTTQLNIKQMGENLDVDALRREIYKTYDAEALSSERVISACEKLAEVLEIEPLTKRLMALGYSHEKALSEIKMAKSLLTRAHLEAKIEREVGDSRLWRPLGTLFHIPAGNVDALPFFSVLEGLLVGNVNLLKSPLTDGGLSVFLFEKLIAIEPKIKPYLHVFDVSSTDVMTIKQLIDLSNAVVIWGGDHAITALRNLVPPNVKLIEWGHKLSFAYVSSGLVKCFMNKQNAADAQQINDVFDEIAYNMCDTDQLYCNSAQGIYVDSDDFELIKQMGSYFCHRLNKMSALHPRSLDTRVKAKTTLSVYTEQLEALLNDKVVYTSEKLTTSVLVKKDSKLEPSIQFRNCWIKPLPENQIIGTLAPHKGHLQTVGLACLPQEREALRDKLLKAGLVQVKTPMNMSTLHLDEPHDGEYPLRLYTRNMPGNFL